MMVRNKFSARIPYLCVPSGDSRTKQSFKAQCDINRIMGRYAKGQIVDHLAKWEGDYGFAPSMDFRDAMEMVTKAQEMFADLDSAVRKRFANSPAEFLEFAQDPKNIDELRKMGLAKPIEPAPTAPGAAIAAAPPSTGST